MTTPTPPTVPPELPTGTVTFLFTDLEGSTRLLEAHPAAYRDAVRRHHDLLRVAVEAHGGVVFETVGDAVYAAFARPTDAVAAALAGQVALQREDWGAVGPLRARMGLHHGEVERQGAHYFGAPLYRCARLMATAHGGQVVLSGATAELVQDELPGGRLRDLGEHRLKDLARPERVFQLVHPALPADFPPLRTVGARANNLPAAATPLVGREVEVEAIRRQLLEPGRRLVTLTGPGGIGKTRLALAAAAAAAEFRDGVVFVELAPISAPDRVLPTVAHAIGIREAGGCPAAQVLIDYLRAKQVLLVLDNFEHVLSAATAIGELLAGCPSCRALVTSREALRLYGEQEHPVSPLGLPERGQYSAALAVRAEAVRLFEQRGRLVRPDFHVNDENAAAISELCRRLDGLPLAIELAAARLRLLPPRALLARLQRRLPLLTGGPRDAPARHQTLRQAIAWSYDLLSPDERRLLCRLAVFVGGCSLEATIAVCVDPMLTLDPLEGLDALVAKSLLNQTADESGDPRFAFLETIREFALEQLEASGEGEELRRRHAAYYVGLAERAEPRFFGPQVGSWMDRTELELDNFRAAYRWGIERGDPVLGLRLIWPLWGYWWRRGLFTDAEEWAKRLLALAGDAVSRRDLLLQARGQHVLAHIALLRMMSGAGYTTEDREAFRQRSKKVADLFQRAGDVRGLAIARFGAGMQAMGDGDHETAVTYYAEARDLLRQIGDAWWDAWISIYYGRDAQIRNDVEGSRRGYTDGLARFRALDDPWATSGALKDLGTLARDMGDHANAQSLLTESLLKRHGLKDTWGTSVSLTELAGVAALQGDEARAARLYGAAEALSELAGARRAATEGDSQTRRRQAPNRMLRSDLSDIQAYLRSSHAPFWEEGRGMSLECVIDYAAAGRAAGGAASGAAPPAARPGTRPHFVGH